MPSPEAQPIRGRPARARVGVIGLGGLGPNIAWALVRAGVGAPVLADPDVMEADNLDRQSYFRDQVGLAKTERLQRTCRASGQTSGWNRTECA